VPWQIERNDAEVRRDIRIAELVAILPAVGSRRMQANQRNALAVLFVLGAIGFALALHVDIAPNDRIMRVHLYLLAFA
jgi:hypothetical protein